MTNADKLACAERELRLRHRVYPRLVMRGQMSQHESERELELMAAIAADYRELVGREQLKLFG